MSEVKQTGIARQSKIQKFLSDPSWELKTGEFFCTGETVDEFIGYMGMTKTEHKHLVDNSPQYNRLIELGESQSRAWWSRAGRACISSKKASYKAWESANPYLEKDKQAAGVDVNFNIPKSLKVEFVKSTVVSDS